MLLNMPEMPPVPLTELVMVPEILFAHLYIILFRETRLFCYGMSLSLEHLEEGYRSSGRAALAQLDPHFDFWIETSRLAHYRIKN